MSSALTRSSSARADSGTSCRRCTATTNTSSSFSTRRWPAREATCTARRLDQLVGSRYLVTVHGPRNPVVSEAEATADTDQVRERIARGRFHPATPDDLSYAIGSTIARRQGAAVRSVADRLPALEVQVMNSDFQRPEELLEQLFLLRHELLVSRTMAAQCHDIYARLASLDRHTTDAARTHAHDLREQFERTRSVADGESQFLFGVIELYQTRVTTKMTPAMERLAVIAAITPPHHCHCPRSTG